MAPATGELPARPVILVSLRTRKDLSQLPKQELIHAVAFFCDSPSDFVLLGRAFSVDSSAAPLDDVVAKPDDSGIYNYVVLMEISRPGSPNARPPEVGFNLASAPRSVCIRLQGGSVEAYASSDTVRVSAKRIRQALAHLKETDGR
jgi:hypothetical protein